MLAALRVAVEHPELVEPLMRRFVGAAFGRNLDPADP